MRESRIFQGSAQVLRIADVHEHTSAVLLSQRSRKNIIVFICVERMLTLPINLR